MLLQWDAGADPEMEKGGAQGGGCCARVVYSWLCM